jgi:hypothetical protein
MSGYVGGDNHAELQSIADAWTTAVTNKKPNVVSISPSTAVAGGTDVATVTVTGTGFHRTSRVRFAGAKQPTTVVSGTSLTFGPVEVSSIVGAHTYGVTVVDNLHGMARGSATFSITA